MNINDLEEDSFLLILERCRLPFSDLVLLRSVSRKWHLAVNRLCRCMTSLKLFGSTEDVACYCRDLIRWNLLGNYPVDLRLKPRGDDLLVRSGAHNDRTEITEFITNMLPNVKSLTIGFYLGPCPIDISQLLSAWPGLHTFALVFIETISTADFWKNLNSLTSLKHLFLFEMFSMFIPKRMPVLSRLDSLLVKMSSPRDILPAIQKIGVRNLWLNFDICSGEEIRHFISRNPDLLYTLTHLSLGGFEKASTRNQIDIFEFIAASFANLSYLDVWYFSGLRLTDIVPKLLHLTNLTELRLRLGVNLHTMGMDFFRDGSADNEPALEFLLSVKVLHLNDYTGNPVLANYLDVMIPLIFPATEHLVVRTKSLQLQELLRANGNQLFPLLRKLDLYETVTDRLDHTLSGRFDHVILVQHLKTLAPELKPLDDEYIDPNTVLLVQFNLS